MFRYATPRFDMNQHLKDFLEARMHEVMEQQAARQCWCLPPQDGYRLDGIKRYFYVSEGEVKGGWYNLSDTTLHRNQCSKGSSSCSMNILTMNGRSGACGLVAAYVFPVAGVVG
jgi:hypothetical protein